MLMGFRFRLALFFVAALVAMQELTAVLVYQATRHELIVEGQTFVNTLLAYDSFNPGRFFDDASLDPADWAAFRTLAHRMLDDSLDHIAGRRDQEDAHHDHVAKPQPFGFEDLCDLRKDRPRLRLGIAVAAYGALPRRLVDSMRGACASSSSTWMACSFRW